MDPSTLPEISQKCLDEKFGTIIFYSEPDLWEWEHFSTHCQLVCPADASYKQLDPDQTLQNVWPDLDPNYLTIW